MEWIATAIAVIAAAAAVWQAFEARRARREAQGAASESRDHEERAVAAAERTAKALEEQAAIERSERERYRSPWVIERERTSSSVNLEFRLGGDEVVRDVHVQFDGDPGRVLLREELPNPMHPGQAGALRWVRTMGSPPSLDVHLNWTRENGEEHVQHLTLP